MGIIDIPGERFNLAGKEATFSLSDLCVVLEMTIATSRGGDAGHGVGAPLESDAAGPRQTAVHGESPPAWCLAPASPCWTLGQPDHPGHPVMAADGLRIARTPGPSPSAASQPHPEPGLPEQRVAGALVAVVPVEGGRSFSSPCPPPASFPPVGKRDFGWCPDGAHWRELKSRV